jgi:ATP-dependent DNA helicase RecG
MTSAKPMNQLRSRWDRKTIAAVQAATSQSKTAIRLRSAATEILAESTRKRQTDDRGGDNLSLELPVFADCVAQRQPMPVSRLGRLSGIGTHALIQEAVKFHKLGFVVVDEQHRFGVLQRAGLIKRGYNPDVLVMTATPIPRSLVMSVYGDLDLSIIDEMPPGRKEVITRVRDEGARRKIYQFVDKKIRAGGQAYIVYPLVEESEKMDLLNATQMAEHLQTSVFPNFESG